MLFSLTSFSQDEILGRWYLNYTNVQGTITHNAEFGENHANIEFTENATADGFEYSGFICNGFWGSYINNNDNTISKVDFTTTLVFCNGYNTDEFENDFFVDVLGSVDPTTLNYEVTGTGIEETLVLTNAENVNFAVFGRNAFNENLLGNWFLHYRLIEGVQQSNNLTESEIFPSINFSQIRANPFEGLTFEGNGACNSFFGYYTLINSEIIEFNYFVQTLGSCTTTESEDFNDPSYFYDILYPNSTTQLLYEITGPISNQTLTLTNLSNNNVAVYGRQTLSATDVAFNKSIIKLKENPVEAQLEIVVENSSFNQISYAIYAVDGKIISSNKALVNNTINLNNLNPGLYFIKMQTDDNQTQILKFIKE
jgi:heat shock protein HslJ